MNNKNCETLRSIFDTSVPSDLQWKNIETLFIALGAIVKEGKGSRVRVILNGVKAVFHEPHPTGREVGKSTVKHVRTFLENAQIDPEDY